MNLLLLLLQVFGISSDAPEENKAFATAQRLPFPLLSDPSSILRKVGSVCLCWSGLAWPGRGNGGSERHCVTSWHTQQRCKQLAEMGCRHCAMIVILCMLPCVATSAYRS